MMMFNPAIRLMNRLTYSRKMLVAGLFFCIPITLLAYFLVTNIREQVEFGAKERSGVRFVVPLRNVLSYLLENRRAVLSGGKASPAADKVLGELDLIETHLGSELATGESVRTLKAKLGEVNGLRGAAARQTFDAHSALVGNLLELIVLVADNSNLTLDPDIDSYYLMDTLITKLPPLVDALARMDLIASRLMADHSSLGDRTDLIVLCGQVRVLVDAANKNIHAACAKNPALSQLLQKPFQDVGASSAAFLKEVTPYTDAKSPSGPLPQSVSKAASAVGDAVFAAIDVVSPALDRLLAERIHAFQMRMNLYLSLSFLAFLLGIYLNIGCFLSVREGIASVRDVADRVANGDLTVEAPQLSQDELGEMARMFNVMIGNLHHIIVTLTDTTGRVHSCAGKLSDSVEQQSGFSTQLSSSVVEISSTMEEFSSTASQIAQHSQGVVERADKTLEDTKNGAAEVENLNFKINDISDNIQANLSEIVELGRKSKEINKVMEIINNIANQTKLIAFNAALEAASAGEAGKRFGVVAVEIRRLADSVVESTTEIEGKITEILDSVNRLVMSSEKSFQLIQEGQEYASHTVSMLIESVDGVAETTGAARQISLSTQQQQIASSQVVLALKDIEQGVGHATNSIRQTNGVTDELLELSEQLGKLVMTFKIDKECM